MKEEYTDLSTDMALSFTRSFLREMAQPINPEFLKAVFLDKEDIDGLEDKMDERT